MELSIARERIRADIARQLERGRELGRWRKPLDDDQFARLKALDPETATLEEVDALLGEQNGDWDACSECEGKDLDFVAFEAANGHYGAAQVCKACLTKALALFPG
jgi:hypothetical protein